MIRFDKVSKTLDGKLVLDSLSLEVPEGQCIALLGVSGSGKTTALKLACGLTFPDSGNVEIDQTSMGPTTARSLRLKLGYVVQDGGLFPHLTGYRNLSLIGREAGLNEINIKKRVAELCDIAQIEPEVLQRYPFEISGGQRQRVGLMRALFHNPPILLLDEPLGALDPITRAQLQKELAQIFSSLRKTVLLVTHDLYEASYLGNTIALLQDGQITQQGSFSDFVNRPANAFVQLFISSQTQRLQGHETGGHN